MALVELSVVEQRYHAVMEVLAGAPVTEVAGRYGVSRQSVHTWMRRYREGGLGALADRSHRVKSHPMQTPAQVEVLICELRRAHPRWGPQTLLWELRRRGVEPLPSRASVYRALVRNGLIDPMARKRKRSDYVRWERPGPMQLWQMDIMGGVFLADGTECKLITGIDDHARFCVIASVVVRATGRAVCAAFAGAMRTFGVPQEVLTDNGKQFTCRFGGPRAGEVLFERICRENGITARTTKPRSPTTTGKIERFHQTVRRELLDQADPFDSLQAAQASVDAFVIRYNTARPHQALDMAFPVDRFTEPRPHVQQQQTDQPLALRLPAGLAALDGLRRPHPRTRTGHPSPPRLRPRRRQGRCRPPWKPSRWTGSSPPRATCRSPASRSGSVRTAPGCPSRCGSAPPTCMCSPPQVPG